MDDRRPFGALFPKVNALPGSLHLEWVTCGAPGCHCTRGVCHGPYVYRRWYENGKQRKAYVRKADVHAVQDAIHTWHKSHPPAWTMRRRLTDIRRLMQEAKT